MRPIWWLLLAGCSQTPAESGSTIDSGAADSGQAVDMHDSDGDGVTDTDEIAAGTDPNDPRSASAWQPDLTERPRLLVGPAGLDALRANLARPESPWSTLTERIESACADEIATPEADASDLTTNGNIALSCAVLAAGGDADAGQRAVDVLEALSMPSEIDLSLVDKVDLHAGQGLLQGARAWDLLQGIGYPDGRDPDVAKAQLHAVGELLWDFYVVEWPEILRATRNNHNTKLLAAWAALGFAANDDPRSARYVTFATAELARLDDVLFADDGGYGEGPSYHAYAMQSVLPWLAAWDRYLGDGETIGWRGCAHDWDTECTDGPVTVVSTLRSDPRICASYQRFAESLMPSGQSPNTDDANLSQSHLGLAAQLCDDPIVAWGWERQASAWVTQGSVDLTADTLAAWTGDVGVSEPVLSPVVRVDAGYAILRSGIDADAEFVMLLAESGVARSGGGAHEHPDALQVLWSSGGEYLIIDSGYGHYEVSDQVSGAEAHNTLRVDGVGSSGVDADSLAGDSGSLSAGITLEGVRWERSVSMGGAGVLVVRDSLQVVSGAPEECTFSWHADSEGLNIAQGVGGWPLATGGRIELGVLGTVAGESDEREAWHGFSRELEEHDAIDLTVPCDGTELITVAHRSRVAGELSITGDSISWPGGVLRLDGGEPALQ